MAKSTLQPRFRSREHYEVIRQLVTDEPRLGDTFEQWQQMTLELAEKLRAKGTIVKEVLIDPEKFAAYCHKSGIGYNSITFQTFMIYTTFSL